MRFSVFEILVTVFLPITIILAFLWLAKFFLVKKTVGLLKNKRLGGLFILLPILFFITSVQLRNSGFLLKKDFFSLVFGLIIILSFGLLDDLKKKSWSYQAAVQSVLAIILIVAGDSIRHIRWPGGEVFFLGAALGAILTYLWVVVIINSLNWLDGVDGLAGTVSLIAFATLGLLSLTEKVNQPSTAAICFAIVFILTLFLAFNFPPARFYLGTVGIWTLGFFIAVVSLYSGGKVATTSLVLSVPLFDFALVFSERVLRGRSPVMGGDRLHLHQRLIEIGWSHGRITVFIGLVTSALGIGTLIIQTANKIFLLLPISLFFFALALFLLKSRKVARKI